MNSSRLGARFRQALDYAAEAHEGQVRKGTDIPYVAHVLDVASTVIAHGGTEDEAIAALLHDTVEDAGGEDRLTDVERRFGPDVARIVLACSDTTETPKPPWRKRKQAYLQHLRDPDTGRDVLLVTAADKLDNARDILDDYRAVGNRLWKRFNAGRNHQLWYYSSLDKVFSERLPGKLSDELRGTVGTLVREVSRDRRRRIAATAVLVAVACTVATWAVRRRQSKQALVAGHELTSPAPSSGRRTTD